MGGLKLPHLRSDTASVLVIFTL